ncbi:MAG: class I SAM-dependent methyltransferase [Chloroflexota bacterium]
MTVDSKINQAMIINQLLQLQEKPALFAPGEEHFWTDPHIASQMLAAHLNPNLDAASRRPEIIQKSTDWIMQHLDLQAGDQVLDLGCGPGLYASQLARHGLRVTGLDFSQNSLNYAQKFAHENELKITYRCQNYLELTDQELYDTVLLIFGDYCPLSPDNRSKLLANVRQALKPGAHFVLDVSTPHLRRRVGLKNSWYAAENGFWKPGPHLVLEQGFAYSEQDIYLDQYTVIESDGKISVFRNWFQDFTPATIRAELEDNGFLVESLWGDLQGSLLEPASEWIGVVARK